MKITWRIKALLAVLVLNCFPVTHMTLLLPPLCVCVCVRACVRMSCVCVLFVIVEWNICCLCKLTKCIIIFSAAQTSIISILSVYLVQIFLLESTAHMESTELVILCVGMSMHMLFVLWFPLYSVSVFMQVCVWVWLCKVCVCVLACVCVCV